MTMSSLSEAKLEDDWAEDIKRYHDSRKNKKQRDKN
jgi:hypothetical protein